MNLIALLVSGSMLLIACVLVLSHMLTQGRRGRRWGGL